MNALFGLRQFLPSPPHACGIPRLRQCCITRHAPDTGTTEALPVRPVPLGGRIGAEEGGLLHKFKNGFLQSRKMSSFLGRHSFAGEGGCTGTSYCTIRRAWITPFLSPKKKRNR